MIEHRNGKVLDHKKIYKINPIPKEDRIYFIIWYNGRKYRRLGNIPPLHSQVITPEEKTKIDYWKLTRTKITKRKESNQLEQKANWYLNNKNSSQTALK